MLSVASCHHMHKLMIENTFSWSWGHLLGLISSSSANSRNNGRSSPTQQPNPSQTKTFQQPSPPTMSLSFNLSCGSWKETSTWRLQETCLPPPSKRCASWRWSVPTGAWADTSSACLLLNSCLPASMKQQVLDVALNKEGDRTSSADHHFQNKSTNDNSHILHNESVAPPPWWPGHTEGLPLNQPLMTARGQVLHGCLLMHWGTAQWQWCGRERVTLTQALNLQLTKDEEQRQFLLQLVKQPGTAKYSLPGAARDSQVQPSWCSQGQPGTAFLVQTGNTECPGYVWDPIHWKINTCFQKWGGPAALPVNTMHPEDQWVSLMWLAKWRPLLVFGANRHWWSATTIYLLIKMKVCLRQFLNTGQNSNNADEKFELLFILATKYWEMWKRYSQIPSQVTQKQDYCVHNKFSGLQEVPQKLHTMDF